MTLDELREMQDREGLRDRHLVYLGEHGFVLAHTDEERALASAGLKDLRDCPIHRWLQDSDFGLTVTHSPGVYRIVRRLGEAERPYRLEPMAVMV